MASTTGETEGPDQAGETPPVRATPAKQAWYRRALPFVFAGALLVFVAVRVDYAAFIHALARLDYVSFIAFALIWAATLLGADALGTYAAYRITLPGVRWFDLYVYRGASYIPSTLNHHVGQAYLTYLMSKLSRVSIARMAGATLVSYAAWFGCLFGCVAVALPFSDLPAIYSPIIVGGGLLYLIVIAVRPARLARVSFLSPLFEAGVKGHLIAFAARIPHLAVLVLGTWGSFRFFDVNIPIGTALVYIPILLVAITLPITPQGFGTRDTLSGIFFARFTPDTSHGEQLGRLAACTTSWGVLTTIIALFIGVLCSRIVQKRLAEIA
jgi:hypothetical protein